MLRGLTHRWSLPTTPPPVEGTLMDRLLASRGMTDPDAIDQFRSPSLHQLHPPSLLPEIDRATDRILEALRANQRIVIYGDYDVDGVAGTAILYRTIRALDPKARLATYIPHRLDDGYGLNVEAMRLLRSQGTDLVVSVDCGISATEPARVARDVGLDLIITDHHNVPALPEALPSAVARVHPRLPDSAYPFGELCGAGVAFKVAWHLATRFTGSERVGAELREILLNLLPLAALGTIADVVPLTGENRVIASIGLRLIKQTPIVGLRALIESSGLMDEKIDCEKVGFILGPQLNACGRMGHAAEAVHMLTDATPDEAQAIARRLAAFNTERQQTERAILAEAERLAEDRGMTVPDRRIIVLAHQSWHAGVVGIVCSRLVDRFHRPVILLQHQGDMCKGSARSVDGYSIIEALASCADLLATHGGHDMAAGLSLPHDRFEMLVERLTEHANARIAADALTPSLRIDCDARLDELDLRTVTDVSRLSPFGRGNPRPTLRVVHARVADRPRQMGANGRHLFFRVGDGERGGSDRIIRAVWWNRGELANDLSAGTLVDVAIEPKLNTWNGQTSVEVEVRDIRLLAPASVAAT